MDTIVPIGICVVMPVAIVLITFIAAMNSDNKRAQILIKAIEAGNGIDAYKLAEALRKPQKNRTSRELLNARLLRAGIFTFLGIALIIYGIYLQTYIYIPSYETFQNICFLASAVLIAIGLGYAVVYFITRKQTDNK